MQYKHDFILGKVLKQKSVLLLSTKITYSGNAVNAIAFTGKENITNKIVIEVTNPFNFSKWIPPESAVNVGYSSGEQIQELLPD
ncbi:MAG: hypothetical protein JST21_07410 [Bacteroidetes bacterium]|nr:hypothetical protein [Bacteroidota bacterium]